MHRFIPLLLTVFIGVASAGCASTKSPDNDPFEGYNRAMTNINLSLDKHVLVPVAKGYRWALPSPVRTAIGNFFRNLNEPYVMLNDILQGKFAHAGRDAGRFVINSTIGFLGLIDLAGYIGIERRSEDFGQTMAVWGVPPGPHLVLPLFGPSNIRDGIGLLPDFYYNEQVGFRDSTAELGLDIMRVVDTRHRFLGTEEMLALQPDQYLFLREGYRQRRALEISDGEAVDEGTTEDDLLNELLEEGN